MHARFEINHRASVIAPFAIVFGEHFLPEFGSQFAVPEQHLHGCARQSFFNIDLPFAETNEAFRVGAPLPVFALESIMQIARFSGSSAPFGKYFERRVFLIITFTMRVMRQAVVVTDQIAVNINSSLDAATVRPGIFT